MPNLKEVRNRIVSVNSTMQITSAMKMVSAAKLKKAQDLVLQMRPYADKLHEILQNLSSSLSTSEGTYSQQRKLKHVLCVAISSNRGLCGAFNSNVIKQVNRLVRNDYSHCKASVLSIGKKAGDFFKKTELNIRGSRMRALRYSTIFEELTYENSASITQALMDEFADGEFDKILLVYNRYKNAAVQILTVEQLLPVLPPEETEASSSKTKVSDYIFEPNREQIVQDMIPKSLKTQLFKALLESHAAEHGARMTAMHMATDNASELIKELRLSYNKARQAAITSEILEIVGGAEALKQ